MVVSYKKHFQMLMEKNMTAIQLQEKDAFSANITPRMKYEKWNEPRRLFYWKNYCQSFKLQYLCKIVPGTAGGSNQIFCSR